MYIFQVATDRMNRALSLLSATISILNCIGNDVRGEPEQAPGSNPPASLDASEDRTVVHDDPPPSE